MRGWVRGRVSGWLGVWRAGRACGGLQRPPTQPAAPAMLCTRPGCSPCCLPLGAVLQPNPAPPPPSPRAHAHQQNLLRGYCLPWDDPAARQLTVRQVNAALDDLAAAAGAGGAPASLEPGLPRCWAACRGGRRLACTWCAAALMPAAARPRSLLPPPPAAPPGDVQGAAAVLRGLLQRMTAAMARVLVGAGPGPAQLPYLHASVAPMASSLMPVQHAHTHRPHAPPTAGPGRPAGPAPAARRAARVPCLASRRRGVLPGGRSDAPPRRAGLLLRAAAGCRCCRVPSPPCTRWRAAVPPHFPTHRRRCGRCAWTRGACSTSSWTRSARTARWGGVGMEGGWVQGPGRHHGGRLGAGARPASWQPGAGAARLGSKHGSPPANRPCVPSPLPPPPPPDPPRSSWSWAGPRRRSWRRRSTARRA